MKGAYTLGIVICFILILIFTTIYSYTKSSNSKIQWPPHISKCPEYWVVDPTDSTKCIPMNKEINVMAGTSADRISEDIWQPDMEEFSRFKDRAMIRPTFKHWDGISNYYSN